MMNADIKHFMNEIILDWWMIKKIKEWWNIYLVNDNLVQHMNDKMN